MGQIFVKTINFDNNACRKNLGTPCLRERSTTSHRACNVIGTLWVYSGLFGIIPDYFMTIRDFFVTMRTNSGLFHNYFVTILNYLKIIRDYSGLPGEGPDAFNLPQSCTQRKIIIMMRYSLGGSAPQIPPVNRPPASPEM